MICRALSLIVVIAAGSAWAQFDMGSDKVPKPVPETTSTLRAKIKKLASVRHASSLHSLLYIISFKPQVAEEAEAAFLKLYDQGAAKGAYKESLLAINRSLGIRLTEAYHNPSTLPEAVRRKAMMQIVATGLKESDPPKDFTVTGRFVCGVVNFNDPQLLARLVSADTAFVADQLLDPKLERKTALLTALRWKSPQTVTKILPMLVRDPRATIRASAIQLLLFHKVYNPDPLLLRAASDPYAIVREAAASSRGIASEETQSRIKQMLLGDPVDGVRKAAAAPVFTGYSFGA